MDWEITNEINQMDQISLNILSDDDDQGLPELSWGKLRAVLSLLGEETPRHLTLLQVGLPVQVLRVDVAQAVLVGGVKHL